MSDTTIEIETVFEKLSAVNVKEFIKELQGAKYIPWAIALRETLKVFPSMTWGAYEDKEGLPFFASSVGIFVKVWVNIEGEKQDMFLPVLNSAHKTLKLERYSYLVNEYKQGKKTGQMIEKFVEPATSFDVNTAIMRALVKCLAVKGMALYVYLDEVMPEEKTINSAQLQEITSLCKTYGYQIADIAQQFGGYAKIANIPESRFEDFMIWATPKEK